MEIRHIIDIKATVYDDAQSPVLEVSTTSVTESTTSHGRAIEIAASAVLQQLFVLWNEKDREYRRNMPPESSPDSSVEEMFERLAQMIKPVFEWSRVEIVMDRRA